jgi:hypothetical protein
MGNSVRLPMMIHLSRKFVAVLLAVWFPLFSGNALAVSIVMQSMAGDCNVAQVDAHHTQHDTSMHQHMHHAELQVGQHLQHDHQNHPQNTSRKDCGVCQLACCGFMATVAIAVAEIKSSAQLFALSSTQFQSFYSAPLVPPPLASA